MHGLILAGGRGSRLAAEGVNTPKALVAVAGRPQVIHLIETFVELGCASVTCMMRDDILTDWEQFALPAHAVPVSVRSCRTPSSLHTLVEGLAVIPSGPVFCAMVDTVMPVADWRRLYAGVTSQLAAGSLAVLAVTPFVDDERPLYVKRNAAGLAVEISDHLAPPPLVTGGVYGLSPAAREIAAEAIPTLRRMRAFLRLLVRRGGPVATVEVPRIIDLDHKRDLDSATAWLAAVEPAATADAGEDS
jgi:NDP-sugar pyrophosphorylase family protein